MRILKIEITTGFHSEDPELSLEAPELRQSLFAELEALRSELVLEIRSHISGYLPTDYETFVRLDFQPENLSAQVTVWVDDPNIRWPAGLLSRRAWSLSVPILKKIVKQAIEARLIQISLSLRKTEIFSYAPKRIWSDPLIVGSALVALTSFYWVLIHPAAIEYIRSLGAP